MWTFGAYGGVNPAGYTTFSLLGQVGLSHSMGPGLIPAHYLLSGFLSVPSFPTSALVTLDFLSLTFQFGHCFLQSFFVFEIEYDIDDGSLVLESL